MYSIDRHVQVLDVAIHREDLLHMFLIYVPCEATNVDFAWFGCRTTFAAPTTW